MWDHPSEARTASGYAKPSGQCTTCPSAVERVSILRCGPFGRSSNTPGTHDELIARNGYYTSLFEKQRLEEELSVAT
jgi:hypothetical protein